MDPFSCGDLFGMALTLALCGPSKKLVLSKRVKSNLSFKELAESIEEQERL